MRQFVRTQEHNRPARDRRATYTRIQRQRRFHVEALEERRLMTIPASVINAGGDLIVNTQQGASSTVYLGLNTEGGEMVNLNGQFWSFPSGAVTEVTVNLNGGNDTLNIEATASSVPVTVGDGAGNDDVIISPFYLDLSFIQGNVTVDGGTGYDTLTIDDQSDLSFAFYTMTGSSVTRSDSAQISYELINAVTVNGSMSAAGTYNVQDTAYQFQTNINTGSAGNTVNVQGVSGPLYVNSVGLDTVNVGNAGSVQAILSALYIDDAFDSSTVLNIDDSTDPAPRNVTLDTYTTAGDTPWGTVIGLAPGGIAYRYGAVSSVNITTGQVGDTVNVHATGAGVVTNLNSIGGSDTVNVGNARSVQGIAGTLNIENPNAFTALTVDDSADASARNVTLDTFTPSGDTPWGSISGLAPASINYEYADVSSVSLKTGLGADTINVHATGVTTNVISGALHTVNVGNAGSVQGILGTLNIENPNSFTTLNVDDSADHFGRTVTLNAFTPSGDTPWASITGLAPAAINYEQEDLTSPITIKGGLGGNTFNVVALPVPTGQTVDLDTGGGNDKVNVETTSGSLVVNGQGGTNTLVGPNGNQTWHITGTGAGTVGVVSFSSIQNLTGGTGNDLFVFNNGCGVTGTINGGGGSNELDYAAYSTAVAVNLASHSATGTGGFANIQTLVGGSGSNTLVGPNATNTWNITSTNGGNVAGVTFSAFANLTGGTGMDVFKFSAGKGVTGKINGGGGGDWLDYSSYTTAVTVNLAAGTASGVLGGVTNIANVRGGAGTNTLTGNSQGNILIGGAGTNIITGGSGRSILIGDTGAATVKGGTGDDIVIGGYTNYDTSSTANDIALEAILAEWRSADSYTTRISKIKAGVPGGSKLVWGTTVHDNAKADTLTGGGGLNWFFKGTKDTITDYHSGEQIN